jgi:hypothetical protein
MHTLAAAALLRIRLAFDCSTRSFVTVAVAVAVAAAVVVFPSTHRLGATCLLSL